MTITWSWTSGAAALRPSIWICLGDSEMEGTSSGSTPGYPPGGNSLRMVRPSLLEWITLSEPNGSGSTGPAGFFGWNLSVLQGQRIGIVNTAQAARQSSYWLPANVTGYARILSMAEAALDAAYPDDVLAGFLLYDGANDAAAGASSSWAANWTTTLAQLRSDLGGEALTCPIIYSILPAALEANVSYPGTAAVRADQAGWAASDRVSYQIPDAGPWGTPTYVHLAYAGNVALGDAYADVANAL